MPRKREEEEAAQPPSGKAAAITNPKAKPKAEGKGKSKGKGKGKSPAPVETKPQFFISDDGKQLPVLPDDKWQRVKCACYFFQTNECKKSADECMKVNKKKHDKLPKELAPYCRKPGQAAAKARSASRTQAAANPTKGTRGTSPSAKDTKVRWDTIYCWDFADGKCKHNEEDCPRKPHLTEAQAKAAAKSKARAKGKAKAKSKTRAKSPGATAAAAVITSTIAAADALDLNADDA